MQIDLNDPTSLALAAADALATRQIAHALYGGLPLAAYGEPRETRDADFAVVELDEQGLANALSRIGAETTITFTAVPFGGLLISRITLLPGINATGLNTVDLVRPRSSAYARRVLDRAIATRMRGRELRLVSPEDFIVLKVLSTRDRDIEDAASVLRRGGTLIDAALIDQELDALSVDLPDVSVQDRMARVRART